MYQTICSNQMIPNKAPIVKSILGLLYAEYKLAKYLFEIRYGLLIFLKFIILKF